MSSPIKEAQEKQYIPQPIAALAGWNADAGEHLGVPEFSAVENLRIETVGELTLRSGYRLYESGTGATPRTPLAKTEYFIGGVGYDITFFHEAGSLIMQWISVPNGTPDETTIVGSGIEADSIVCALQFSTFLVCSVYDKQQQSQGTFLIWYSNENLTGGSWNVRPLGKQICPQPDSVRYAPTVKGDLLAFETATIGSNPDTMEIQHDPGEKIGRIIPIDCSAQYWITGSAFGNTSNPPSPYERPLSDIDNPNYEYHTNNPPLQPGRLRDQEGETEAYGYKFVAVQTITDPRGQKITIRSHPSVDMWVRNNNYMPAQLYDSGTSPSQRRHVYRQPILGAPFNGQVVSGGGMPPTLLEQRWYTASDPDDIVTVYDKGINNDDGENNSFEAHFTPSKDEFYALQTAVRGVLKDDVLKKEFQFLAHYLGNRQVFSDQNLVVFGQPGGETPYWDNVPANVLKQAPLVQFSFTDFDITGLTSVTEIEIYRTAYCPPNEKDAATESPLYGKYRYGYVGSIKPDGVDFLDDIADDMLDFGRSPTAHEGLLEGEFAGQVCKVYDNRIVLGNIETRYSVMTPTKLMQAEQMPDSASVYTAGDFFSGPTYTFHYTILDADGHESNPVELIPASIFVAPTKVGVWLLFPRGYNERITSVNVYRGEMVGLNREYRKIKTLPIETGFLYTRNTAAEQLEYGPLTPGLPTKTIKTSTEPGAMVWSSPNEPMEFALLNFETRHQFAPITAMETLTGPLWVLTDRNTSLTELSGKAEEKNEYVGCVSRFACAKVDTVLFFLSQHGVYMADSGVRAYPALVSTEIRPYLEEVITGQPTLANVRRASMGWLGRRNELWLHIPSSKDLGGILPHRTFIYKFIGGNPVKPQNYAFDLTEEFEIRNLGITENDDPDTYRSERIIFYGRADGNLFASFHDPSNLLATINNDVPGMLWEGRTVLEKMWISDTMIPKSLRSLEWRCVSDCEMTVCTGGPKPNGSRDRVRGAINARARIFPVNLQGEEGFTETLRHRISGPTVETTSRVPITRIETHPIGTTHNVKYTGMCLYWTSTHAHF